MAALAIIILLIIVITLLLKVIANRNIRIFCLKKEIYILKEDLAKERVCPSTNNEIIFNEEGGYTIINKDSCTNERAETV